MAKRTGQLAGLAALGALGYLLTKDRKKANDLPAPGALSRQEEPEVESGDFISRRMRMDPTTGRATGVEGPMSPAQVARRIAATTPSAAPTPAAPAASTTSGMDSRAGGVGMENYVPRRTTPTTGTDSRAGGVGMDRYVPRRPLPKPAGAGRGGQGGPTAEELEAYRRAPRTTTAAPQARGSAVDQIPKDSSLYTPTTGEPVTGNEFTRNVSNTLRALTPMGGGFGNVGMELLTAKGAAERVAKAKELAEAARKAQPGTKFTSTRSSSTARANEATKRTRKFNEDEAGLEFKKGGRAKAKKMASGGMTSSASSRGDGIASRGKTKCKMY